MPAPGTTGPVSGKARRLNVRLFRGGRVCGLLLRETVPRPPASEVLPESARYLSYGQSAGERMSTEEDFSTAEWRGETPPSPGPSAPGRREPITLEWRAPGGPCVRGRRVGCRGRSLRSGRRRSHQDEEP